MKQLNALLFKVLPNSVHYGFCCKVSKELSILAEPALESLGPLVGEFNNWLAKEKACMEWQRKSSYTHLLQEANKRLDRTFTGLRKQVSGACYSNNVEVAFMARQVFDMLKSYGNVCQESYMEEVSDINVIIERLQGEFLAQMTTTKLTDWTSELVKARNNFVSIFEVRDRHFLDKPAQGFTEVRKGIETVWHQIAKIANANLLLNTSIIFTFFVEHLNLEIDYLNTEYHRVRYNIATAQPAPIEQQSYTGQFITPLPEVYYVTSNKGTIKLELGKDFNVSYKDNVQVGNASCIIRGKGEYMGKKLVTFIIARGV
jgi:hypothetical protein